MLLYIIYYLFRIFVYVIRDLVDNNNNGFANCIVFLLRKSNQPEDAS